jgi:hypothetical protein
MLVSGKTDDVNDCTNNPNCQDAADRAVKKVFAILGVDIDKPESVEEFRSDLRFGKRMRKAADHGFLALVGLVVVGIGALLWAGIVSRINGGT